MPESSLVRESELVMLTRAGPEIGVASTKAFTTQLAALGMLVMALAKFHGADAERERGLVQRLLGIPSLIEATLKLDPVIKELAERFVDKQHALFLGRGPMYPIALEGALKLKEISYIHAEAYPAGELKHGPLALVDADMPVITIAPNNDLLEKLKSNLQEVRARGGELYVFADPESGMESSDGVHVIEMPRHVSYFQAPAVYTIPLQLLAYHCAILKGTDVDQPRNLAKSGDGGIAGGLGNISALLALESKGDLSRNDPAAKCIWELMDQVDGYIPTPPRATDQPFLMPIEDVFGIKGRGTVATGRIERGIVKVGDNVEIVGMQELTRNVVVTGVEMFQKTLDQGLAGDNVGCLLRGIERADIERGQVLAKPGSINARNGKAQVYVLSKEEGGRHTPFFNGYRPQFMRTTDVTGAIKPPEGVEMVIPGDNIEMTVELI